MSVSRECFSNGNSKVVHPLLLKRVSTCLLQYISCTIVGVELKKSPAGSGLVSFLFPAVASLLHTGRSPTVVLHQLVSKTLIPLIPEVEYSQIITSSTVVIAHAPKKNISCDAGGQ